MTDDLILVNLDGKEYIIPKHILQPEDLKKFKWREFPK